MSDDVSTPFRPRSLKEVVIWGTLVTVILGLILAAVAQRVQKANAEPLPVIAQLPNFELTNRDGRLVSLAQLQGAPFIADFIFTRCNGICPFMTKQMSRVVEELPPNAKVGVVSFSVDPDHDTPEVLQAYAEKYEAPDFWYFLTGTRAELHSLSKDGFLLAVADVPEEEQVEGGEPIVHSNRFVLVDGQSRIRGYYDAFDENDVQRLLSELQRLLNE